MPPTALDTVRAGIAAFNRGDLEGALEHTRADLVWHVFLSPDGEVARGHDEVRRMWAERRDIFDGFEIVVDEYVEVGDCVIAVGVMRGQAGGEGAPAVSAPLAQVYRLDDAGLLREVRSFRTRDEAVAYAAGSAS